MLRCSLLQTSSRPLHLHVRGFIRLVAIALFSGDVLQPYVIRAVILALILPVLGSNLVWG